MGQLCAVDAHGGNGNAAGRVFDIDKSDVPRHFGLYGQGECCARIQYLPAAAVGGDGVAVDGQGLFGEQGFCKQGNALFAGLAVRCGQGHAAVVARPGKDAAEREVSGIVPAGEALPVAAVADGRHALPFDVGGVNPAYAAVAPCFLQAFAQGVGKEVAGGMRVADLQDAEGCTASFIQGEAAALL